MPVRPNVLFITLDQFRADCLFGALADEVDLPHMAALARDAVSFRQHYSVTAPCGPSRASLMTGQYAMNHRAVRNGTPLRADAPTLGHAARAAGYEPLLYGYSDSSADPRHLPAGDPRLTSYEEVSPGFTEALRMRLESDVSAWTDHLAALGIDVPEGEAIYRPQGDHPAAPALYPAEASDTAFLTDRTIADLAARDPGWFAHVTYIRPHPPFVAPAPYNAMYDPTGLSPARSGAADPFAAAARASTPVARTVVGFADLAPGPATTATLRALYFGLASEVDHHIGRLIAWLRESGQYDDTLIVLTSDHGELLGDYGIWGKSSYHDAAYHVPLIIRAPGGGGPGVIDALTESIDIAPTILDLIGAGIPPAMDGRSLRPFLETGRAENWRDVSLSELDFGNPLAPTALQSALGLRMEEANLAVLRRGPHRLVQFAGDLDPLLFDMQAEGEARDLADDPDHGPLRAGMMQAMLSHRMQNTDATFKYTMITPAGAVTATRER